MYQAQKPPINFFLGWEVPAGYSAWVDIMSENSPSSVITGSSGAGKTNLFKHLMDQASIHGISMLILDCHGDLSCDGVPSVSLSDGPTGEASLQLLGFSCIAKEKYGSDGLADIVIGVIDATGRAMGASQETVLRKAIKMTLERGETGLNDILAAVKELKGGSDKRMGDVVDSVVSRIERLSERNVFSHKNGLFPSRLVEESLRIDCSGLSDVTRGPTINMILSLISQEIRAKGTLEESPSEESPGIRKMIFVDEAKIPLSISDKKRSIGNPLEEMAEQGRKFGIGVIMASQSISDFSTEITTSAGYLMAMTSSDGKERKRIAERLGVPFDMVTNVWRKGVALVRLSTGNYGFVQIPKMPQ